MKRVFWAVVGVLLLMAALGVIEGVYVLAPLLGLLILRVGFASFGSLRAGASYVPDGPPVPVDLAAERTSYWCSGCGAEMLLLVRGSAVPPRHCGERMRERQEVPHGR